MLVQSNLQAKKQIVGKLLV